MSADLFTLTQALWTDGPLGKLALATSGAAVLLGVFVAARAFSHTLDARTFGEEINKLIFTKNLERALKLCSVAPNLPQVRLVQAVLLALKRGETARSVLGAEQPRALASLQRGMTPALGVGGVAALSCAAVLATRMGAMYFSLVLGLAIADVAVVVIAAVRRRNTARDLSVLVQYIGSF